MDEEPDAIMQGKFCPEPTIPGADELTDRDPAAFISLD